LSISTRTTRAKLEITSGVLKDERFAQLFENPDFEIEPENEAEENRKKHRNKKARGSKPATEGKGKRK